MQKHILYIYVYVYLYLQHTYTYMYILYYTYTCSRQHHSQEQMHTLSRLIGYIFNLWEK
jgi:hypothetical protein